MALKLPFLLLSLLFVAACDDSTAAVLSYPATVLRDAPASYFRFGASTLAEGARDEKGVANAKFSDVGVTPGARGAIAGDSDTALAFDGAHGFVAAPDVYTFDGTHPFTLEVWVAPSTGGLPIQRICNHRLGVPTHHGWLLFIDDTQHITCERWDGDIVLGRAAAPIPLDTYSYVVARYDGRELALFVDGTLRQSVIDEHPISSFSAPLVWGAASTQVLDFFSGRLDEGAIYTFALSDDGIRAHFAAGH